MVTNSPVFARVGVECLWSSFTLEFLKFGLTDCTLVCCSENEALWREVASLRQKHAQQQKVVNKV